VVVEPVQLVEFLVPVLRVRMVARRVLVQFHLPVAVLVEFGIIAQDWLVDQVVVVAPLTIKVLAIRRRRTLRRETMVVQEVDTQVTTTPVVVAVALVQ
jgi:hypothetical protein